MNNDYDRGEEPRYTMTSFNKEISPIEISEPIPTVRLLLLKSGETVISIVEESLCGTKLTLVNPRIVLIESAGDNNTTVMFGDWMPLAQNRTFDIRTDYVVTSTYPLDSLIESYLEKDNG
ncbi:hypothetical protein BOW86_gp175 [Synechococcus phage S-CAM7]|uniref:Uncharacterized protein n=1 Tax=Synechococcus phage S-CAM7 TaxID=1883368 RepID=A0A1D8KTY6_9CAUD|nr:hypothetical protein BOW86_gp175 [Synechococcus phage S-CAM7]AOV62099.1 hypothetical protein C490910_175 [Synechococcus phage S-CAM7]AOV62362.1 hypothetical protein S420910_174 [Synechococcus phage S-CAM7]QLF86228.1 hypothetical protein CC030809_00172 [Synechococcus phage S-CAM7]